MQGQTITTEEIFKKWWQKKKRTVKKGLETTIYCAPQLWSLLPEEIKSLTSQYHFKN